MNPKKLLELLTEKFPLEAVSPSFRGHHDLHLDSRDTKQLLARIWVPGINQRGRCLEIPLTTEDLERSAEEVAANLELLVVANHEQN